MLYMQTDDSVVEATLLFAIKRLTSAVSESWRKVLHDGNSVIKMCTCLYCTLIMKLNMCRYVLTSSMTLAGLR